MVNQNQSCYIGFDDDYGTTLNGSNYGSNFDYGVNLAHNGEFYMLPGWTPIGSNGFGTGDILKIIYTDSDKKMKLKNTNTNIVLNTKDVTSIIDKYLKIVFTAHEPSVISGLKFVDIDKK